MANGLDLSDVVKRAVQANAKFSKRWMDLSFEYLREISAIMGGATESAGPVTEVDVGASALVLEGEAGTQVRGSFLVSNDMDKPVSCVFAGSVFKDPRGASVKAKPVFEPPTLELGPGEQRVVQVSIDVDDSLSPGVGYAGELSVRGLEGFAVPVVLRRQHTVEEPTVAEGGGAGDPAIDDADASRTPRRKAAPKRRGRGKAAG